MGEVYPGMGSATSPKSSMAWSDAVIRPEEMPGSRRPSKLSCDSSLKERFAVETTFHGVGYWLSPERSSFQRLFYFLLWLLMAAGAVLFIYSNVARFYNYETKVSISRDKMDSMAFPSVTICPESSFLQSRIGGSRLLLSKIDQMRSDASLMKSCFDPSLPDDFPDMSFAMAHWETHGNRDAMGGLMIPFERLFLECSFQLEKLPCEELFVGHWTTMSRCFTFNHVSHYNSTKDSLFWQYSKNIKRNFYVAGSGPKNRLELRLNLNLNETCEHWTTDHVGFRLIVNDRTSLPYFVDKSILLAPGFRTQISVEEIRLDRNKTENLGRCSRNKDLFLFDDVEYTRDNCIVQCLSEEVYKSCGCIFAYLPKDLDFVRKAFTKHLGNFSKGSIDMCYNEPGQSCMLAVYEPFMQGKTKQHCHKNCPVECFRKEYQVQSSVGIYPPEKLVPELQSQTGLKSIEELQKNLLEVDVFIRTMEVMIIDEDWAMTSCELFSNLGGTFGLFLGASVFSFIELINFVVSAIFGKRRGH